MTGDIRKYTHDVATLKSVAIIIQKLKTKMFGYFDLNGYLIPQSEAETAIREGVSFRPHRVRSVSLYHSDKLKNMPKNSSASMIKGTTLSPEK